MPLQTQKIDIHEEVTNKIIDLLDQVSIDDSKPPFAGLAAQGLPLNPITDHRYQGVNILSLWCNQQDKQYPTNKWATYKQWKEEGHNVKKGEKGSRIIFYKTLIKEEENNEGKTEEVSIPMLKTFSVFNAAQVEGFEEAFNPETPTEDKVNRIKLIEEFCKNTQADIRNERNNPFYSVDDDYINMPETRLFLETPEISATENYYGILLHELTHWSGAKSRLDRFKPKNNETSQDYAFEELTAELGAAFLCAQLGLKQTRHKEHAIYIKSWLEALKNDKTYIFKAAAQASKASQYLNSLQKGIRHDL